MRVGSPLLARKETAGPTPPVAAALIPAHPRIGGLSARDPECP